MQCLSQSSRYVHFPYSLYSLQSWVWLNILTQVFILVHKPLRKKALRSLSHENIVKCRDLILDQKGEVHMVFEMLHGGNLEKLTRNRTKPFSENQIRSVFFQLLSAAKHMHSFKFLHRDIKPENILLVSAKFECDTRIKLADLGQAKRISSSNARPQTTYVATRWYRSPELLLRISSYSFPSDLWAIGAVMTELINLGEPLFPGSDEHDQLSRIVSLRGHPSTVGWRNGEMAMKKRRIHLPRVTPSSLRKTVPRASLPVLQLISDLLELDPTRRPSAVEALQYPLFASRSPVLSQHPSRKKRKIESLEKDTARTRDFPSSRWSGDSDHERHEYTAIEERNASAAKGTHASAVENTRRAPTKKQASECRSMLFKIPRLSSDNHESSEDYGILKAMRDPAGAFDLRTSG